MFLSTVSDDIFALRNDALKELVFHDRSDVSSCAAAIVERVIRLDRDAGRLVSRLIRSSVPRLMRFTSGSSDSQTDGITNSILSFSTLILYEIEFSLLLFLFQLPTARVVGSLRLLCRLSDSGSDATIAVALAAYLSRSIRTQQLASEQQPEQQVTFQSRIRRRL